MRRATPTTRSSDTACSRRERRISKNHLRPRVSRERCATCSTRPSLGRPGGCRPMADMRTVAAATSMVFMMGLVCVAGPVLAQQPDSTLSAEALKKLSIEQLMNLQVTSVSKRPERLSQTASAIQVITQEEIRRSGASSLAEALRLATNLQVAQVDSRQWAISARGFNSTTANKLLVLIDGRTVYTPLFSGVFWDVQEVPLADIDRIEVISGPGATLWGANAVNGVINVITKDTKDTMGMLVSGGGGTKQRAFGTVRYGGALGSRVRARIYGRGFGRDATGLPGGGDAFDDWHLWQGGFRVDWDASNVNRATLQGDLYDGRIGQPTAADIAVSGGNVMAKWAHTISETSRLAAQLDYVGFEVQPSGRVNWRLSSSGTVWAAVSRALRSPSRIDRELFAPAQPPYFLAGGPGFHSEEELAYELGYRHQEGSLALSVATFYSRYHGLRSLEQTNPPAATPIAIGNRQAGESYGAELTAADRVSDRWRLRAGYTELRVHIWPNPGSTDRSRGASESHTPDRQFFLWSSVDLPADLRLDAGLRAIDDISNQQVPAYAELNAKLSWQPMTNVDLSLVGQNLLHDRHVEFGAPGPTRREIERGVYGALAWHF